MHLFFLYFVIEQRDIMDRIVLTQRACDKCSDGARRISYRLWLMSTHLLFNSLHTIYSYFFIYIFLCLNIFIFLFFLFTHLYTFFICPAESCRFQITSIHGTGYVTFWYQGFLRMENTSRSVVPVHTLEMATLFSLGCLVLGRYESKKVFWRNCINVDQTKMLLVLTASTRPI